MYPQSINDLFLAPVSGELAMEQFTNASNKDRASLAQLQQQMKFDAEKHPLSLEEMTLKNRGTGLDNEGKVSANSLSADKAHISRSTLPQQTQAAIRELAQKMSDSDLKVLENGIQQMMYSNDPAERAKGQAMYNMSKEIVKQREIENLKGEWDIKKTRQQGANAANVEKMGIDAGKYNRTGRGGSGPKTVEDSLLRAKSAKERLQVLVDASIVAAQNGNEELAAAYAERARAMEPQARAELAASTQKPGTVDVGGLTKGEVPTAPNLPITPNLPNTAQRQSGTVGAHTANTGDRVRVVSPDGKVGTIPKSQLKDALGMGYKESK